MVNRLEKDEINVISQIFMLSAISIYNQYWIQAEFLLKYLRKCIMWKKISRKL